MRLIRIIGWTLAAALAGAALCFLGTVAFVEMLHYRLLPPKPGEGFNYLGLVLKTGVVGGYYATEALKAIPEAEAALLACHQRSR
jgi:hypothetical protein